MASEHLKQADVFLPEERWGDLELESSTERWLVLVAGALGVAGCVLMVIGGGAAATWWGAGTFVAALAFYTFVALPGIDRQNERVEELLGKKEEGRKKKGRRQEKEARRRKDEKGGGED